MTALAKCKVLQVTEIRSAGNLPFTGLVLTSGA